MNISNEVILLPFHWKAEEFNNTFEIWAWTVDRDSKPHLVRFQNYKIPCYLSLPISSRSITTQIHWNENTLNKLLEKMENAAISAEYEIVERYTLYYYQEKKQTMLKLLFQGPSDVRNAKEFFSKGVRLDGIGIVDFELYETDVTPIRKFLTSNKTKHCQWFKVPSNKAENKVSTLEYEWVVNWSDLKPIPFLESNSWRVHSGILAFDIECHSGNLRTMPDPCYASDAAFLISVIYQRVGLPESRKRYAILYGDCKDVKDATIIRVDSEIKGIHKFCELIRELNPQIITGYNVLGFDYPYLHQRLKRRRKSSYDPIWPVLGCVNREPQLRSWEMSSSAFGHNEINHLIMDGRITIDLLPLVKRFDPYTKLDLYTLDFVSNHYLKRGKHDVKARQIFQAYHHWKTQKDSSLIDSIVEYCIRDAELVIDLFEHLNVWVHLTEMANIVETQPEDLYLYGQQVRMFSQVYNRCELSGIVMNKRNILTTEYEGAHVYEPEPGLYNNIICLDFSGMYPSIMIEFNICPTTIVKDSSIPDEKCHLIKVDKEGKTVYRYIKQEIKKGVVPEIVQDLVTERAKVKDLIKMEKDTFMVSILKAREMALKIAANSVYGALGAQEGGKLPFVEGARSVTGQGRNLLEKVDQKLKERYGAKTVYGDSVTADTPVLIKWKDSINYMMISKLVNFDENDICDDGKYRRNIEKENLYVWSDQGWTKIKYIMGHKTNKKIYRVLTHTGLVDVTEDHSLLNSRGEKIRPSNLKVGDTLLHKDLPRMNISIIQEDTLKLANLYLLLSNLGYKVLLDKDESIHVYRESKDIDQDTIQKIELLRENTNEYVYDFETENHHFAAGIGRLVVHNTDSVMVDLGIKSSEECFKMGKELAQYVTKELALKSVKVEFEKAMRIFTIKKKMYAYFLIDEKGKLLDNEANLKKKGIVLARRETAKWIKKVYAKILIMIMMEHSFKECFDFLVDSVKELLDGKISWRQMICIKGLGKYYKNNNYFVKAFADQLNKAGITTQAGERLEYVVVEVPGEKTVGKKMRSPEQFEEALNSEQPYKLDYLYYLDSLRKRIDQLFGVGFRKEMEELAEIGYRPINRRRKFVSITEPTKLLLTIFQEGGIITYAKKLLK